MKIIHLDQLPLKDNSFDLSTIKINNILIISKKLVDEKHWAYTLDLIDKIKAKCRELNCLLFCKYNDITFEFHFVNEIIKDSNELGLKLKLIEDEDGIHFSSNYENIKQINLN